MWLTHNTPTQGDTYSYIVVPKLSAEDFSMTANETLGKIQILANTPQIQAVYNSKVQVLQIVFWAPGTIDAGIIRVNSDTACLVQIKLNNNEVQISVANPTQLPQYNEITITLGKVLKGNQCIANGSSTMIKFALDDGELAGSSKTIVCTS